MDEIPIDREIENSPAKINNIRLAVEASQIVTAIAAVISIIFTGAQFAMLRNSFDRTDRQNNIAAWAAVTAQELSIDDLFIQQPDLQKYFYGGAAIPTEEKERDRVMAVATKVVDTFENIEDMVIYVPPDRTTIPGLSIGEKEVGMFDRQTWEKYIVDTFQSSPAACEVVRQRGGQYDQALNELATRGCLERKQ